MKQNSIKRRIRKRSLKDISSKLPYEPFYKRLKRFHEEISDLLEKSENTYLQNTIAQIFKGIYEAEPLKVKDIEDKSVPRIRKRRRSSIKEIHFKIDIIGKKGVGISTLVNNYCHNMFPDSYMNTVGVDFYLKEFSFDGTSCILQLWIHSNDNRFKPLRSASLAGSNGLIIIYDLTDPTSLQVIQEWIPLIRARYEKVPIMLLGNKLDLNENKQVEKDDIIPFLNKYDIQLFFEISALTAFNVDFAFNNLLLSILEKDIDNSSHKNVQTAQSTFEKIDKVSKPYTRKFLKKKGEK